MPNSGTVTAGSVALASQYNNLRSDVLDASTGHTHSGAADSGARVEGTAIKSTGATSGYVLTAGVGGTATTWSAPASSGALSLSTASAAYATAASGTAVTYTGGGANLYNLGVGCGGTVFLSISNANNYSASARVYRTWNLGTGGASYIATSSVSPVAAGTVISDMIGGAGFAAGTAFVVKENYGSGGTWNTRIRRFTTALTNSWTTTLTTFGQSGNQSEYIGPFGGAQEQCIKWAQGPGIWYGGDYRTTGLSARTGESGAGTVSIHIINDVSGSAYSAPFGTASGSYAAATYATVFVPSVGTATSGTIHAWGNVTNAANTGTEFRYCTYSVGSASITALSTAVSDTFNENYFPVAARWDEATSQVLLYVQTPYDATFVAGFDRTLTTLRFISDENAQQRTAVWTRVGGGSHMLRPNVETPIEMQHDLTTGFFASTYSGKVVLSKHGTLGNAMTAISPILSGTATTVYSAAVLAGAGSATDIVFSGTTGNIRSWSTTAGLATVATVGTSSAAFRQVTTTIIKPLHGGVSIKTIDAPGGYEVPSASYGTGDAAIQVYLAAAGGPTGGLAMQSYTHILPGTSTMTVTVTNSSGTGAYRFQEDTNATFRTAGGTAFIQSRIITMA